MSESFNSAAGFSLCALLRRLKPALLLLLIVAASVLVLALVNNLTADTAAQHTADRQQAALSSVMPGANVFSEMYNDDASIDWISGAYDGTTFLGYCAQISPIEFGGNVCLVIGVDTNGIVTGISVLDENKTVSPGAQAVDPIFLKQYIGKSASLLVRTGHDAISSASGATVANKTVSRAIHTALSAILNYDAQGGLNSEEHG